MKAKILMSLMHRLTLLLSKVARKTSHTLNDWKWKFGKLADKLEDLSISKEDKKLFEEWKEEEDRTRAEEEHWEDESYAKYAQWKKEHEQALMKTAIQDFFQEMSDYELEFFKDFVVPEIEHDNNFMSKVIVFVAQSSQLVSKWDMEEDLMIMSELCKSFAFMYNTMTGYVRRGNLESRTEAIGYAHQTKSANQLYLDAYDFETKRRFAESLDLNLPKHDKPKIKRAKI